jgi:hypothetical protein
MKYQIILSGRGSESYVHQLSDSQYETFKEMDVENSNPDIDQLAEILEKNDVFETDNTFLGPYNDPENYIIEVFDENETLVWTSSIEHEFSDYEFECKFDNDKALIIEDYSKGQYFSYTVDCDEFNPEKLKPVIVEVGERFEVITNLMYDDKDLNDTKEWLDYWSKGLYYYLNNKLVW